MNRSIKAVLNRVLPASLLSRLVRFRRVTFTGPYSSWSLAAAQATGYNAPGILDRVTTATREVIAGRAAFERDAVTFYEPDPDPVIIGALQKAVPSSGPLRVLDFGGSLGSSYHQHRRSLSNVPDIEWHVVEQGHFVDRGRAEFQTGELRFHRSIEEACNPNPPHAVLLSSVLQYLEDPWSVLTATARLSASSWIINRTPFHRAPNDLAIVQHVPPSIYRASYPAWVLSEPKFNHFWRTYGVNPTWHPAPEGEVRDGPLHFSFRTAICART
jgi:putative methyltransferase (TIGR04325 family)